MLLVRQSYPRKRTPSDQSHIEPYKNPAPHQPIRPQSPTNTPFPDPLVGVFAALPPLRRQASLNPSQSISSQNDARQHFPE